MNAPPLRVAILTISDAGSRGARADTSGEAIADWIRRREYQMARHEIVPDEVVPIASRLTAWSDQGLADLILTTGGTGLSDRDVTPEATASVIEKPVPGIAEALRSSAYPSFPRAILSRGLAGIRGRTLIVNLPGSPGGVRDGLAVLETVIDHAVELLRGKTEHS
jgi:molybdopterin adenylyltransferase